MFQILLILIFIVYIIFLAISAFFKVLARGAATIASGVNNSISDQKQAKADEALRKLSLFFDDILQEVSKFAIEEYKLEDKETGVNCKDELKKEIITIELYFYILFMIENDFVRINRDLSIVSMNIAYKKIYDYIQKIADFTCDTTEEVVADICLSRIHTYMEIMKKHYSNGPVDISTSAFCALEDQAMIVSYIENDFECSQEDNLKLYPEKLSTPNNKLKYKHNVNSIFYLTNNVVRKMKAFLDSKL